jgi:pyridoxal 5'-phosphate synthase pdxT subunit
MQSRYSNITTVGVLALQGDVREHAAVLGRCGVEAAPVRSVAELDRVDALVIPGGESTTMGHLIRVHGMEAALRSRLADGMPCLATCAGLILLSHEVLDGRADQLKMDVLNVSVKRNGWGRQVESFEADLTVDGLDEPFHGVFIRAPRIVEVGAEVEVLATHSGEPVAVSQGNILGLTFHPEMTHDSRIHELFVATIRKSVVAA